MLPLYLSPSNTRFNFDGYVVSAGSAENGVYRGYLQVFRSGVMETVDTGILDSAGKSTEPLLHGSNLEGKIIDSVERHSTFLERAGAEPPIIVMLSLLGVRGYFLVGNGGALYDPIDRNDLIVPEVLVGGFGIDVGTQLRAVFDPIWQAAGEERSQNYDSEGNRKATRR
jgi:hypothetical protein